MSLRSINPYTSYQTLIDMQRTKDQLADLSEQLSSGNRLTRLSDDPTASSLVLDFQDSIDKNKAYIQQSNSATSFLQTTETTLSSVEDTITRILELGQQGLNNLSNSQNVATEVSGLKSTLITLANTQTQGKYIFGGSKTTSAPFTSTAAGASYAGDHSDISLDVSASTKVVTNLAGDTVFFNGDASAPTATTGPGTAGDLFAQVTNLINGLQAGNSGQIQTAFDNLKAIRGNIDNCTTIVGGRQASLQQLTNDMQSYNLSLQTIQSSYQDVDYPTAITEYTQAQTAQQASLSVLAKTSKTNLFDYLS